MTQRSKRSSPHKWRILLNWVLMISRILLVRRVRLVCREHAKVQLITSRYQEVFDMAGYRIYRVHVKNMRLDRWTRAWNMELLC
jgi:hypothetical protein